MYVPRMYEMIKLTELNIMIGLHYTNLENSNVSS